MTEQENVSILFLPYFTLSSNFYSMILHKLFFTILHQHVQNLQMSYCRACHTMKQDFRSFISLELQVPEMVLYIYPLTIFFDPAYNLVRLKVNLCYVFVLYALYIFLMELKAAHPFTAK